MIYRYTQRFAYEKRATFHCQLSQIPEDVELISSYGSDPKNRYFYTMVLDSDPGLPWRAAFITCWFWPGTTLTVVIWHGVLLWLYTRVILSGALKQIKNTYILNFMYPYTVYVIIICICICMRICSLDGFDSTIRICVEPCFSPGCWNSMKLPKITSANASHQCAEDTICPAGSTRTLIESAEHPANRLLVKWDHMGPQGQGSPWIKCFNYHKPH